MIYKNIETTIFRDLKTDEVLAKVETMGNNYFLVKLIHKLKTWSVRNKMRMFRNLVINKES